MAGKPIWLKPVGPNHVPVIALEQRARMSAYKSCSSCD